MSVVFKARQAVLNRLVALKVLSKLQAGEHELARFRAEAAAIASLRHPNIVQVYEVGENAGQALLYSGIDRRRQPGRQDSRASRKIPPPRRPAPRNLGRAVHYAHEHGIIHRDLKPANILLQEDSGRVGRVCETHQAALVGLEDSTHPTVSSSIRGSSLIPKIADFGLAKHLFANHEQTQSGAVLGTPSYMPPEQAQGRSTAIGPAADIYGLGAMLYELLTGRPPFAGATPLETLRQVVHDEPVAVTLLVPGVPRDLETICLKCLQKEPQRRYGSALDLAEDLQRFLGDQPISARPSSVLYRCGKFARRNKGLVGGTLAVLWLPVGGDHRVADVCPG